MICKTVQALEALLMFVLVSVGGVMDRHRVIEVFSGFTVILPCGLDSYFPIWVGPPTWRFYSNGSTDHADFNTVELGREKADRLTWANNKKDLVIVNLSPDDSGHYMCVMNGRQGIRTILTVKDVQAVGYPYTVTCDLDLGFHYPQWLGPPKAILYSRDGTARLTPESKAHSDEIEWAENKRDLVITEVKEKHAGVYSCEHDGKRRSEVTVHPEHIVLEGEPHTITCNIPKDYPSWHGPPLFNGVSVRYNHPGSSNFNPGYIDKFPDRVIWAETRTDLHFREVRRSDDGLYTCSMVVESRNQTDVKRLKVLVKPQPPEVVNTERESDESIFRAARGTTVALKCVSKGGYPAPIVTWYKGNVTLSHINSTVSVIHEEDDTYTVTQTHVLEAREDDVYSCQTTFRHPPYLIQTATVYVWVYDTATEGFLSVGVAAGVGSAVFVLITVVGVVLFLKLRVCRKPKVDRNTIAYINIVRNNGGLNSAEDASPTSELYENSVALPACRKYANTSTINFRTSVLEELGRLLQKARLPPPVPPRRCNV